MIVKIAAWFYLANAGLSLLSALLGMFDSAPGASSSWAYVVLFGTMGYGLLKRTKWGYWMALGWSLLGWTLGALMLIAVLVFLVVVLKVAGLLMLLSAGGVLGVFAWIVFLALALWAVEIFINFKLFWHLCSPEGCQEFGQPPISARTLIVAVGAWVGLLLFNMLAMSDARFLYNVAVASMSRDSAETDREQAQHEREARRAAARAQRQAEIEANQQAAQSEQELGEGEPTEGEPIEGEPIEGVPVEGADLAGTPEAEAPSIAVDASSEGEVLPPVSDAPPEPAVPAAATPPASEEDAPSSRKIIKCRDNAGAITFTQGYCPPGTRKVDMESGE